MNARRFGIAGLTVAGTLALIAGGASLAGLRLNTTPSAPEGLWRVTAIEGKALARGTMVEACPPDMPIVDVMRDGGYLPPGRCPPGVAPLLKPVAAIAGDRVTIKKGQPAAVNGYALARTAAAPSVTAWPDGDYTVEAGTVWLFSSYSENSFDSRYFGPVPIANVRGQAAPLITQDNLALAAGGQP